MVKFYANCLGLTILLLIDKLNVISNSNCSQTIQILNHPAHVYCYLRHFSPGWSETWMVCETLENEVVVVADVPQSLEVFFDILFFFCFLFQHEQQLLDTFLFK